MQDQLMPSPPVLRRPDAPLFLVLGVPRSGTTALADALNSHPNVFCGIERFDWTLARAIYPFGLQDFLDQGAPMPNFHQRNLDILLPKTALDALGNKKPRYYVSLPSLLRRAPARLVWTYRHPADTAASWNARALNPEDKGWQRGMTGLYALAELVQMLLAFRNLPDDVPALMVDYDALFLGEDTGAVLGAILDFLGAAPRPDVLDEFALRQQALGKRLQAKKRSLYDFEEDFLTRHGLDELGPLMAETRLAEPARLRPAIDALLERLARTAFLDEFMGLLSRYPQSPAADFLPSYLSSLFANAGQATLFDALAPGLRAPAHRALVEATRRKAELAPADGDVARAVLAHARRAAKRDPDAPLWRVVQADQLARMHRFEEAALAYREALALAPRDMEARIGLIKALERLRAAGPGA